MPSRLHALASPTSDKPTLAAGVAPDGGIELLPGKTDTSPQRALATG